MLMILARLVRSESFWAVAKVRSPHTGPEPGYPRLDTNAVWVDARQKYDVSYSGAGVRGANLSDRPEAF